MRGPAEAIALMERAIDERGPEFNYTEHYGRHTLGGCLYVERDEDNNREPGCLIGMALYLDDVPLESLEEHEGTAARDVAPLFGESWSEDALRLLSVAQDKQDNGASWGVALNAAKDYATVLSS